MCSIHRLRPLLVLLAIVTTFSACRREPPKEFTKWVGKRLSAKVTEARLKTLHPDVQAFYRSMWTDELIGRKAADFSPVLALAEKATNHGKTAYGYLVREEDSNEDEGSVYFGILVDDTTDHIVGVYSHRLVD